jgi:hypothetical protein
MALKEEKIKIYGKDDSPESFVKFVPEVVDDLEVFSVVNSKDQHCGYITPELFNFLLKKENGETVIDWNFKVKDVDDWSQFAKLHQKIILDAPKGENRDYIPSYMLLPTTYVGDEPKKALKMIVNKEFMTPNSSGGLELNFNNNEVELNKFYVYTSKPIKTTLNIDLATGKADYFFINELSGSEKNKGDVVFNFVSKGRYAPSIEVIGFKIKPVEDVLNKSFVYPLFEIGGSDFKALESVVSLPSILMNEDDSSLYEIRSLKGDIILTNSEINMLQSNEGKSSSLEAKNDIGFATASVEVCGDIVVNGKIQSSAFPNQRNRTIINLNNSTSQSNLFFKPKNKNALYFNIKDSNLDNGSKSIFIIRDVTLVGVNLKNDPKKDITFANTTVKYSNLFNVSNLCECVIYKTHVENFTLKIDSKNEKIFSYGPIVEGIALTEIEKKITNLLKNTEIELKGADYFRDRTNGSLSITNCVIKGQTTIDSAYEKDYQTVDGSYLITIDNSILKKAELIFNKDVGSKVSSVQISNSEIEGTFVAYDIEKVDGSIINNSLVANILSLKNSVLDSDEIRPDKIIELDGYNSATKTMVDKPKIEIGKITNELEIL